MAAINSTASPLRTVFLISFWFLMISWGLLKTFFTVATVLFYIFHGGHKNRLNNSYTNLKYRMRLFKSKCTLSSCYQKQNYKNLSSFLVKHVILKIWLSLNLPYNRYLCIHCHGIHQNFNYSMIICNMEVLNTASDILCIRSLNRHRLTLHEMNQTSQGYVGFTPPALHSKL